MKKILALLMSTAVLVGSLTGCGKSDKKTPSDSDDTKITDQDLLDKDEKDTEEDVDPNSIVDNERDVADDESGAPLADDKDSDDSSKDKTDADKDDDKDADLSSLDGTIFDGMDEDDLNKIIYGDGTEAFDPDSTLDDIAKSDLPDVKVDFKDIVLVDTVDYVVTLTDFKPMDSYGPTFEVKLENNSDKDVLFSMENMVINGVATDDVWNMDVKAGKTVTDHIFFSAQDLIDLGINYIDTVKADFDVFDNHDFVTSYYSSDVEWSVETTGTDLPPVND